MVDRDQVAVSDFRGGVVPRGDLLGRDLHARIAGMEHFVVKEFVECPRPDEEAQLAEGHPILLHQEQPVRQIFARHATTCRDTPINLFQCRRHIKLNFRAPIINIHLKNHSLMKNKWQIGSPD